MVSKTKLYSQLDNLEVELKERIISHLEKSVDGENDLIFCVSDFNPYPELRHKTDSETEALVALGRKTLSLMEKLGEPSDGSIAERICWYCRKWADNTDGHRKSAQGLAQQFLEEIHRSKT